MTTYISLYGLSVKIYYACVVVFFGVGDAICFVNDLNNLILKISQQDGQ